MAKERKVTILCWDYQVSPSPERLPTTYTVKAIKLERPTGRSQGVGHQIGMTPYTRTEDGNEKSEEIETSDLSEREPRRRHWSTLSMYWKHIQYLVGDIVTEVAQSPQRRTGRVPRNCEWSHMVIGNGILQVILSRAQALSMAEHLVAKNCDVHKMFS